MATAQFGVAALEIIVINALLSADNAVVIALACRNLPDERRRWGILWGAIGVVLLRIVLTFFAVHLLQLPYLRLVGAVLLIGIGVKLIAGDESDGHDVRGSDRLVSAVMTVIVADLVMSIDNVIAVAGAAKGDLLPAAFGLAVSIPLVVVGSQAIMRLIERLPWLVAAGGGLLGFLAGEIAVEDMVVKPWVEDSAARLQWLARFVGVALVVATGMWLARRQQQARTG